jgi:hypothetical protein
MYFAAPYITLRPITLILTSYYGGIGKIMLSKGVKEHDTRLANKKSA